MQKVLITLLALSINSGTYASTSICSKDITELIQASSASHFASLRNSLKSIYGEKEGRILYKKIIKLIDKYKKQSPVAGKVNKQKLDENSVFLIAYGDSITSHGEKSLKVLDRFIDQEIGETFSHVHILPFYPWSSDDGFSVIDFKAIEQSLGNWGDIKRLTNKKFVMFDWVANHISSESPWFKNFLEGKRGYKNLAIESDPSLDYSSVTRPRALPLLSEYRKANGDNVHLWTTFSKDQVDINYADIETTLRMVDVLLYYASKGASVIRLDAIGFLWKEIGTTSIHLKQTHEMIKAFRNILDMYSPGVKLISETNVPHKENISYLAKGEADMVYNFSLPPLLLHTFNTGDSAPIKDWISKRLKLPKGKSFFNFSSSHDGVGVRGAEGLLTSEQVNNLKNIVEENGGRVSYRDLPDGSKVPYELNTAWVDAFVKDGSEDKKALASYHVKLALPGVPAFYMNSIFGDHNWVEGFKKTGANRTLNREKLDYSQLTEDLSRLNSRRSLFSNEVRRIIEVRKGLKGFHPQAPFKLIDGLSKGILGIRRGKTSESVDALTNITDKTQVFTIEKDMIDALTGNRLKKGQHKLAAYESVWLIDSV